MTNIKNTVYYASPIFQTRSIWKMLGPFATASRRTPIHQVSLLSHAVARRLRIDVHDNDDNDNNDNDNAWQRGPLWPHGMGPNSWINTASANKRATHGKHATVHVEVEHIIRFDTSLSMSSEVCDDAVLHARQFQTLVEHLRESALNTRHMHQHGRLSPPSDLVLSSPVSPSTAKAAPLHQGRFAGPSSCRREWQAPWDRSEKPPAATCQRHYPDCWDSQYWSRLVEHQRPDTTKACKQKSTDNNNNKKHLKNVGPIRHCEPPHTACFTLPFTRCRYWRTLPLSHAACASMSTTTSTTTTTTTTRDREDRYKVRRKGSV